jgi:hypothetical protein
VWRVPFLSYDELRKRWSTIEAAALRNEPEERRRRRDEFKASPDYGKAKMVSEEKRRRPYPVPADNLPPLDRPLLSHEGAVALASSSSSALRKSITLRAQRPLVISCGRYGGGRRMMSWCVHGQRARRPMLQIELGAGGSRRSRSCAMPVGGRNPWSERRQHDGNSLIQRLTTICHKDVQEAVREINVRPPS